VRPADLKPAIRLAAEYNSAGQTDLEIYVPRDHSQHFMEIPTSCRGEGRTNRIASRQSLDN